MAYQRTSPWAHIANELRAEAREHAKRDMELGLIFRAAQEEAYAAWSAWDETLGRQEAADNSLESLEEQITTQAGKVTDLGTFKKKDLVPIILTLLQKGEMYGYQITQTVNQLAKGQYELQPGVLYSLLHVLEEAGVIEGEWREYPNRPRRKYYKLTAWGTKVLTQERNVFDAFFASLLGNRSS